MKKEYFKHYNFSDEENYYKTIKTTKNTIVTFNSKNYIVIKYGQLKGSRFKVLREKSVDLSKIPRNKNLILILNERPYKILKYINESEVEDVSEKTEIFGRKISYKGEK